MHVTLADRVRDERCDYENLDRGTPSGAILGRHQLLRDDRLQVQREVHPGLLVPVGRKEVNDSVERLIGIVRMQRAERQVAGFRKLKRVVHRFLGTNLAEKNDIGRLA